MQGPSKHPVHAKSEITHTWANPSSRSKNEKPFEPPQKVVSTDLASPMVSPSHRIRSKSTTMGLTFQGVPRAMFRQPRGPGQSTLPGPSSPASAPSRGLSRWWLPYPRQYSYLGRWVSKDYLQSRYTVVTTDIYFVELKRRLKLLSSRPPQMVVTSTRQDRCFKRSVVDHMVGSP